MEAPDLRKQYQANTENNFIPRARGYLKLFTLIENHGEGPGPTQLRGGAPSVQPPRARSPSATAPGAGGSEGTPRAWSSLCQSLGLPPVAGPSRTHPGDWQKGVRKAITWGSKSVGREEQSRVGPGDSSSTRPGSSGPWSSAS